MSEATSGNAGPGCRFAHPGYKKRRSPHKILQQSLDIVELDLRARGIAEAAAQLFEDAADALGVDLSGDLDRVVVAELAAVKRPTERIGLIAAALLAAGPIAGTILPVAIALLHRLGHLLCALAQGLESFPLRVHGTVRIALAELRTGIAHRTIGGVQAAIVVALVAVLIVAILAGLSLLGLLTFLPLLLLALLSLLREAALGEFVLQLLQPVAQRLLILLEVRHRLVALLLAPRAVTPGVLALLESPVAQLLLLADHVAELVECLLHLAFAGLPRLRHLQIFHDLRELLEHALGRLAIAFARRLLDLLQEIVQIPLRDDGTIAIGGLASFRGALVFLELLNRIGLIVQASPGLLLPEAVTGVLHRLFRAIKQRIRILILLGMSDRDASQQEGETGDRHRLQDWHAS
ncbi:hypothetical protein AC629_36005 [Bradyrhizobium sp. NAS80.1]|nr:hypothetical protein AC629_36005 [Bradyrhizobium sp. NAS80.1]